MLRGYGHNFPLFAFTAATIAKKKLIKINTRSRYKLGKENAKRKQMTL